MAGKMFPEYVLKYIQYTELKHIHGDAITLLINVWNEESIAAHVTDEFTDKLDQMVDHIDDD